MVHISKELAGGNFDVDIKYNRQDELGILAESFRKMSGELKKSFDVVTDEAFTDDLTGLNNRNAYLKNVELFSSHLGKDAGTCTIYVMDLNNLKILNDTKGHSAGDEMLKTVAGIIADVFGKENVFRYGGDEFCAVYTYRDTNPEEKIMDLQMRISRQSKKDFSRYEMNYQAAAGYAIYDSSTDSDFNDTFTRADVQMYSNKKRLKEIYQ
jgi:diguanylate cyclase (GGDEF)-like protein